MGGKDDHRTAVEGILGEADAGNVEIVVSTLAIAEVAYLEGMQDDVAAATKIQEFFSRQYMIVAAVDEGIARTAQEIVRKYRGRIKVSPRDAIHLATAVRLGIPIVETADDGFRRLDRQEGDPPVVVRHPLYEGSIPMPGV